MAPVHLIWPRSPLPLPNRARGVLLHPGPFQQHHPGPLCSPIEREGAVLIPTTHHHPIPAPSAPNEREGFVFDPTGLHPPTTTPLRSPTEREGAYLPPSTHHHTPLLSNRARGVVFDPTSPSSAPQESARDSS